MGLLKLTNQMLAPYIGGQIEIKGLVQAYNYRGEIEFLMIDDNRLRVLCSWMARGEGFPNTTWVGDPTLTNDIGLAAYEIVNIGPSRGHIGGGDRLLMKSPSLGEIITLFPADGDKIDRPPLQVFQATA